MILIIGHKDKFQKLKNTKPVGSHIEARQNSSTITQVNKNNIVNRQIKILVQSFPRPL